MGMGRWEREEDGTQVPNMLWQLWAHSTLKTLLYQECTNIPKN